jgi:hypothetical protein
MHCGTTALPSDEKFVGLPAIGCVAHPLGVVVAGRIVDAMGVGRGGFD